MSSCGRISRGICVLFGLVAFVLDAGARTLLVPATEEADWEGTSYQLAVDSDTTWTVSTSDSWVSVSADTGSGDADLIVTVAPNPTDFDRSATITIDGQMHTLTQHAQMLAASSGSTTFSQKTSAKADPTFAPLSDLLLPAAIPAAVFPGYGNTYTMDPSFSVYLETDGGTTNAIAASSDGGFFVGGSFSTIGGQQHVNLAKFKADSTVDPTFNAFGGLDGEIDAIVVQSNGQLLVSGSFQTYNGVACAGFARLNSDGTLDPTFKPVVMPSSPYYTFATQANGQFLAAGALEDSTGKPADPLVRLNANGTLDTTFKNNVSIPNGAVSSLAVQSDGRILVGGTFTTIDGAARSGIARLNTDGTLDSSFNLSGTGATAADSNAVNAIQLQSNGQILISGYFTSYNGTARNGFARLNSDGSLDASFNPAAAVNQYAVMKLGALQPDGRILVQGNFTSIGGIPCPGFARLNTDGSLDTSFNPGSGFTINSVDVTVALAVQTDGRIVAAGNDFNNYNGTTITHLVRLTTTGAIDPTLAAGNLRSIGWVASVQQTSNGKFIVGGGFSWVNGSAHAGIVQLNADGSVDTTFNPGMGTGFSNGADSGSVSALALQPDGRIIVGGTFTAYDGTSCSAITRLNANGTIDSTFNPGTGFAGPFVYEFDGTFEYYPLAVYALALQPDGRIVAGGDFSKFNGTSCYYITRLNSDGTLDTSFSSGSGFASNYIFYPGVAALGLQTDGRIIVGGSFNLYNGATCNGITRLNADGSLDQSSHFGAALGGSGTVYPIFLQPDGRVVAGGCFSDNSNLPPFGIARFQTDGTLDASFNTGTGVVYDVTGLALQGDGKIVVGSGFTSINGMVPGVIRLNADGSQDSRFSLVNLWLVTSASDMSFTSDGRLIVMGAGAVGGGKLQAGMAIFAPNNFAPIFTTQPKSAAANLGSAVTFTAAASGLPSPTYQWYKGSTPLAGQTGTTLTFASVQSADADSYTVVATNSVGSATSNAATLTISASTGTSGGGGGAPSVWFFTALAAMVVFRYAMGGTRRGAG